MTINSRLGTRGMDIGPYEAVVARGSYYTRVDNDDDDLLTGYQRHGHKSLQGSGGQLELLYTRVTVDWVPESWTLVLTRQWRPVGVVIFDGGR